MTVLKIPDRGQTIQNPERIQTYLNERGILFERWDTPVKLTDEDTQEKILEAYSHKLHPFMEENGFESADVINVSKDTTNIEEIRQKFLKEHTHSEDEIRFFVDGEGLFWFNLEKDDVFSVLLKKGDFISVPKNTKHWFDLAPNYNVKAIRIFSNMDGWVAHYTNSKVDEKYNK